MDTQLMRKTFSRIQSADRENIGSAFQKNVTKENTQNIGRRHFGAKQAFGDIKNIIHNQSARSPFKSSLQGIKPPPVIKNPVKLLATEPKCKKSNNKKIKNRDNAENYGNIDPNYNWAAKSVFTWSEFEEKVARGKEIERMEQQKVWESLDKELEGHMKRSDDLIFEPLSNEIKLNSNELFEIEVPDLPCDEFANIDFFNS